MSLTRMLQRRGTADQFNAVQNDLVLKAGEIGFETDTGKFKVGNGTAKWFQLSYVMDTSDLNVLYPQLISDNNFTGTQTISTTDITDIPLSINAAASQTANLQKWLVNGVEKASLSSTGGLSLSDSLDMNSHKIIDLGYPASDTDAASKLYVDNMVAGLAWKEAVHLLAIGNISLTGSTGTLVIDGHEALVQADSGIYRILLIGQSTATQNGIYSYTDNGVSYTLTRSADADVVSELHGASVYVQEGTTYGTSSWVQSNYAATDFDQLDWVQFSGAALITDGAGLLKEGNTLSVIGTANRISVTPDNVDIHADYAGQTSITTLGTVATGIWEGTTVEIAHGGTGATTAEAARSSLGLGNSSTLDTGTTGTTVALGNHLHNDTYYTKTLTDELLSGYVSKSASSTVAGIITATNYDMSVDSLLSDTIQLNFSADAGLATRTPTGALTFTGTSYRAGATKTVFIQNGAASRTLTFPSEWVFLGAKPTSIAASKTGVLTVTSLGTTEANAVASWVAQV